MNITKTIIRKKEGSVMENMLVALIGITLGLAFMIIIFGAFKSINDRWNMRQAAREYLLIMETEGYLNLDDQSALIAELNSYGLENISLSGTTVIPVNYGDRIYLRIQGTYNDNILALAGGISKITEHPSTVTIERQSTAKQ